MTSKEQYESQVQVLEENSLGARIVLQRQFNKDSTQLETQLAKTQGNFRRQLTEKERQMNEARLQSAETFGAAIGQLFADTLTGTGQSLQEFAGKVLILILDTLEKSVLAASAEAAAKSIAANPTPAGFIQAAITTAAITVAFEAAKAAIGTTTAEPFATGGIVPGTGNTDSVYTVLTPGEVVMNKAASQELAPVLSYLNSMYGGKDFAPGFNPTSAPRQIDGGLMARQIGQGFPSAAEIGREVGRNVPKEIGIRTIQKAESDYQKPRKLTSLR